jgi:AcrR family transcriptional regulator
VAEDRSPIEAVRQRILGAAFAAFMERGYAGTTTREIASRARVSKRELYTLFEDKQAMLAACIRTRAQRALRPLELGPVRDRRAFQSRLEAYGTSFLLEISQPTVVALYRLAILEAESSPEVGRALSTSGREAIGHALSDFVRQAQAARFLGKGDPSTIAGRFMSLLWGNTMLGLLLHAEHAPDEEAAKRRARDAVAALLRLFPPRIPRRS